MLDGQEKGQKNFKAPHSSGTFLLLLLKRFFWSYICLFTDVISQFRKKEVQDKERELPGAASVKAVRRGMWGAGLGGSLAV